MNLDTIGRHGDTDEHLQVKEPVPLFKKDVYLIFYSLLLLLLSLGSRVISSGASGGILKPFVETC